MMSISRFARQAGLTPSALRFYDDAGLLRPDEVDPASGYRRYSSAQLPRAVQLRRLRSIGMPLSLIDEFFGADPDEAASLIDEHVARVTREASQVEETAATIRASLDRAPRHRICTVSGPALATAVDQVLATTVHDPDHPVLNAVYVEADNDSLVLTATDRFRLTTRTLVPRDSGATSWAGTVSGTDLRASTSRLRRSATVTLDAGERTVGIGLGTDATEYCSLVTEEFPDYRLMLRSLPAVTHRVTVRTQPVTRALDDAPPVVGIRVSHDHPSLLRSDEEMSLDGTATGPDVTVWFELTTLYPALGHALGDDVILDLRGPDQPATVRSADDGDLTALVMPCRAP